MTHITRIVRATATVLGLALFSSATAAAQAATHAQSTATPKVTSTSRSASYHSSTPRVTSFRGIALKLNTTPQALETAYKAALVSNKKLTRGQFIEANVLAQNLGPKNPGITTDAILDGVKSGKSFGKTLEGLGLSAKDADQAQREATNDIRRAQRAPAPKDSTKAK